MKNLIEILRNEGKPKTFGAIDIIKNIGPGLLVTVGFIDPGNWASNFAAGSSYGYVLLWVVTLSTIMLIALQHNVAHLGIVTGLCLSEATEKYAPHWIGRPILVTAFMASISTSLAEILGAATTFFSSHQVVDDLSQAQALLTPLLGNNAANIFAIALFLAGILSTITSGMAAGCIFSGMFGEQYYAKDAHSIVGICLSLGLALLVIFFVGDPFKGLLYSQMVLSIQLPFTMFLQVWLTSNSRVMGDYVNHRFTKWWLYFLSAIVTVLNIWLFATAF